MLIKIMLQIFYILHHITDYKTLKICLSEYLASNKTWVEVKTILGY